MNILLVVYDNGSFIHTFPLGLAYIAASLRKAGHCITVYNQDIHHYPEEHLTKYMNENSFDVVAIGVIAGYYQYRKLLKISKAINSSKNRPPYYILGGHGPSPEPEFFLRKTNADIVVIGEGEETAVELLNAISNKTSFTNVQGIAYHNGSECIVNKRRPLLKDIDSIERPAYDLFPIEYYRLLNYPHTTNSDLAMPVLSARGCIFKCNFCYRMDEGYRPRSAEAIIEEIEYLQSEYRITYIDFADELLMSSRERVIKLCEAFIRAKLKFKWCCNGRLNYAFPDILKLMKEAGCVFCNYGIEAFDDKTLKVMKKVLTTKQIKNGVEATLKAGISPGLNVIFGNIGENREILTKDVEFLLKYSDASELRTIRPVTPYPGSDLYFYALEKGLLKDVEDFYENKHINSDLLAINFTEMDDEEYYQAMLWANSKLIKKYYKDKLEDTLEQTRDLYENRNANFRGFRAV